MRNPFIIRCKKKWAIAQCVKIGAATANLMLRAGY